MHSEEWNDKLIHLKYIHYILLKRLQGRQEMISIIRISTTIKEKKSRALAITHKGRIRKSQAASSTAISQLLSIRLKTIKHTESPNLVGHHGHPNMITKGTQPELRE